MIKINTYRSSLPTDFVTEEGLRLEGEDYIKYQYRIKDKIKCLSL